MTIIVPLWQQRPWYPQLLDLLVDLPILLPKTNIISNPAKSGTMTSVNWNLIACTISGKSSRRKEYLEKLENFGRWMERIHKENLSIFHQEIHYLLSYTRMACAGSKCKTHSKVLDSFI